MAKNSTKDPKDVARGRRIWAIRKHHCAGSQEQFAHMLNSTRVGEPVSRGAVGNWELGGGIKPENIRTICAAFPVSPDWIWSGDNPPEWFTQFYVDGKYSSDGPKDTIDDFDRWVEDGRTVIPIHEAERNGGDDRAESFGTAGGWRTIPGSIPEIDASPGAGEGMVGEIVNFSIGSETYSAHPVNAEWVIPPTTLGPRFGMVSSSSLVMLVRGDSMEPTFRSGDPVGVDLRVKSFEGDGIYVFSEPGEAPQIKRLQKVPLSEPRKVRIISDNKTYETDIVELGSIIIHGRVKLTVLPK